MRVKWNYSAQRHTRHTGCSISFSHVTVFLVVTDKFRKSVKSNKKRYSVPEFRKPEVCGAMNRESHILRRVTPYNIYNSVAP